MKKVLSMFCSLIILISSIFSVNVCAKTEIPIAMALDNNYTMPTIVAMTSMLENVKPDTVYKFNLLLSGDFKQENKNKILNLKKKYSSKQFNINFIDMKNIYKNAKKDCWGSAMYYRLMLSSLLKNYDKCIYLDGDTVVERDLSELYSIDLQDNYIAGVKAKYAHDLKINYAEKLKIPSISQYVNSGVLLMNLKKIRDDKLENKFNWYVKNKSNIYSCPDQDIINICCYGKIKILPYPYNTMTKYLMANSTKAVESVRKFYGENEIYEAYTHPCIIHYANYHDKPWRNFNVIFAEKWWYYANKSGFCFNDFINKFPTRERLKIRQVLH